LIAVDVVRARGHRNVRALHRTTLEITRDDYLTPRGDCILGVSADKAAAHLSREVREVLRRPLSVLVLVLESGGVRDVVLAQGSERLSLSDERRIVVRRSSYVAGDTIGVRANKAAADIDRRLVERLRRGEELVAYVIALDIGEVLRRAGYEAPSEG